MSTMNMTFTPFVNLGDFVIALSRALDLANPQLANHAMRVAGIARQLGSAVGLEETTLQALVFAGLLHDTGISSSEMKLRAADFDVGLTAQQHCIDGHELFRDSDVLSFVAPLILNHHIHWPTVSSSRSDLSSPQMLGNLLHLADRVEVLIDRNEPVLPQMEAIRERVRENRETVFAPVLVDTFLEKSRREGFWLDIESGRGAASVRRLVREHRMPMALPQVRDLSSIFASIIDRKSPYTSKHSHGVAQVAAEMATSMGYSPPETLRIEIAALLHDLGKLSVPDAILEKPDALTEGERLVINQHSFYTLYLLENIDEMRNIGHWAAYHHERLDGSGYPFGLAGTDIPPESRLLAVSDIYQALRESRPYRAPKEKEEALAILRDMAHSGAIDPEMVDALEKNASRWLATDEPS